MLPDTAEVVLTTCETSCQLTKLKFHKQKIVTVNRQIMIEMATKPISVFIEFGFRFNSFLLQKASCKEINFWALLFYEKVRFD